MPAAQKGTVKTVVIILLSRHTVFLSMFLWFCAQNAFENLFLFFLFGLVTQLSKTGQEKKGMWQGNQDSKLSEQC